MYTFANKNTLIDRTNYGKSVDKYMAFKPAVVQFIDKTIKASGCSSDSFRFGRSLAKVFMIHPWLEGHLDPFNEEVDISFIDSIDYVQQQLTD